MSLYFYTETAFHHEGEIEFLKELIDESARIGANGIKFQILIDYDELISLKHPAYNIFKKALFSKQQWVDIIEYTQSKGLDVIFMPCDTQAVHLISELNQKPAFIDIHSVSFYDAKVLDLIKKTGISVILGVGGRYVQEIEDKIQFFGNQLKTLVVGFQSFPTQLEEVVLEKIPFLKKQFPELEIGYADHSETSNKDGISGNSYAYLLGARVFEKHITTKPLQERFDWQSAASVQDVEASIKELKRLDSGILNKPKEALNKLGEKELTYRNRQKVALLKNGIQKGDLLTNDNVIFKMSGTELGITNVDHLVGKVAKISKEIDDIILEEDFE